MVLFRSFYEFVSLGIAKSFTQRKMPKENHGGATVKSTPLADTGLSLFLTQNSKCTLLMRPTKGFSKSTIAARARPSIFPS